MAGQKKLIILGDSYSTFAGFLPEGNFIYYPNKEFDVERMEDTWWGQLMERKNLRLLVNESSSGTTVSAQGRPQHTEKDPFISRMKRSLSREGVQGERADLILICGGTNDSWIDNEIGELQYENWNGEELKKVLPAFCYLLDYVKAENPEAEIVGIVNCDLKEGIMEGMMAACRHYGVTGVQLKDIHKKNGHPDKLGMTQICDQVEAVLKA